MGDFLYPILTCVVMALGIATTGALWCRVRSSTAQTHLCARCREQVAQVDGPSRCSRCSGDLRSSGLIAPGTRVRRRMPVFVLPLALFWLFAAGWFALNLAARAANLLQREESTFQGQLICSDRRLEIGAGWWRTREPLRPASHAVSMQGMQFGGKLSQYHGPDGPSRWQLEGRSEASGVGEVTPDAIRLFLSHAEFDPKDQLMDSRIADLRKILLGGPSLEPPERSDWQLTEPFGPYSEVESSRLIIALTAVLSFAGWIGASGWYLARSQRPYLMDARSSGPNT